MKITVLETWRYYSMKLEFSVFSDFLQGANSLLGEGVGSWSELNFLWESEYGTLDGMKRELESFKSFVRSRIEKATS